MKKSTRRSLAGLLLVTMLASVTGCNTKSRQPTHQEIVENRTNGYLESIAEEAELTLREANEHYNEACEKQMVSDSVSAKDTISKYESEYRKAIDLINKAQLMTYDDSGYPDYDRYSERIDSLTKKYALTIKIYERAAEELATARGLVCEKPKKRLKKPSTTEA